jgi:hypothetical protein
MKKDFLDWLLLGRNYSLYLVVLSMEETNIGLDMDGALPPSSPRDSRLIPSKSIGWDIVDEIYVKWIERLTANAQWMILASSETVESEGRQRKQCWIKYIKKFRCMTFSWIGAKLWTTKNCFRDFPLRKLPLNLPVSQRVISRRASLCSVYNNKT